MAQIEVGHDTVVSLFIDLSQSQLFSSIISQLQSFIDKLLQAPAPAHQEQY